MYSSQAVWTGKELLVLNLQSVAPERVSARYRPATDSWTPVNRFGPSPVAGISEVQTIWTGSELLAVLPTFVAWRYQPETDQWSLAPRNPTLVNNGAMSPLSLWTGSQLLFFVSITAGAPNGQYVLKYTPTKPLYIYQRR